MPRRTSDINAAVVGVGFIGVAHVEALRRLGVNVVGDPVDMLINPEADQADIEAALRLDGRNPETYLELGLELGRLHVMMGEHRVAFRDFTKVLQLAPDLAEALVERGRTAFFLGRFAAAAADFRAAWRRFARAAARCAGAVPDPAPPP